MATLEINPKNNSLVILDWDNTLFPSTWVTNNFIDLNDNIIKQKYLDFFIDLDNIIYNLLQKILYKSKVIIVTNALPIWITISSNVLPKTKILLKNIKVISARKDYQKITNNSYDWKKHAFNNEVINLLNNEEKQNIISIGDALYEYKALINLYNNNRILKSIKFVENPNIDVLKDQLKVLQDNIHIIINHSKHLDLVYSYK
jgi:hypothetical protein